MYRSKIKVIIRSLIYITCCLMVIHTCAKFGMPMSKRKDDLGHTKIHGENIKFDIKVKVIQRS